MADSDASATDVTTVARRANFMETMPPPRRSLTIGSVVLFDGDNSEQARVEKKISHENPRKARLRLCGDLGSRRPAALRLRQHHHRERIDISLQRDQDA